ncbi:MAG TPA: carboxypeptidase-like regulatory domain-containing protein [Gemmataceae bacterium]|nr:carboxypeptidase-like regulatory domain-containing protein [Gemmataceae bacterium]
MFRLLGVCVLPVLMLTCLPANAFAHAVGVSCKLNGAKVEVEVYYDDNTPATNAKIQVLDADEKVTLSGVTDEKGRCTFATPAPGQYQVRADAGAGHRTKTAFTVPAAAAQAPASVVISDGPTREEFTRFPWLQVVIAVTVLGGVAAAFAVSSRLRKKESSPCEH